LLADWDVMIDALMAREVRHPGKDKRDK